MLLVSALGAGGFIWIIFGSIAGIFPKNTAAMWRLWLAVACRPARPEPLESNQVTSLLGLTLLVSRYDREMAAVTLTLSVGTTATTENVAPSGFQHWVQPQA